MKNKIVPSFLAVIFASLLTIAIFVSTWLQNSVVNALTTQEIISVSGNGDSKGSWSDDTLTGQLSVSGDRNEHTYTLTVSGADSLAGRKGTLTFNIYGKAAPGSGTNSNKGTVTVSSADLGNFSVSHTTDSIFSGGSKEDTKNVTIENWTVGSSFEIVLKVIPAGSSGRNGGTATVTLSNIVFTEYASETVAFEPASSNYNVYYYPDADATEQASPTTVANNTETIALVSTKGIQIIPANTDYVCSHVFASKDGTTKTLYAEEDGRFYPEAGWSLLPIFVPKGDGTAPFEVGGSDFWTWETAFDAAVRGSNKTVVLNNSYTLPAAGDADIYTRNGLTASGTYVKFTESGSTVTGVEYLVPSGITFLIPYDATHTGLGTLTQDNVTHLTPQSEASYTSPSPYDRGTLTVGANTTIVSNGTVIVNGKQHATSSRTPGLVSGTYGSLYLSTKSSDLLIQSGSLYCYGYAYGAGRVTLNDGVKAYEMLQIMDWRGFKATMSWMGNDIDTSDIGGVIGQLGDLARILASADGAKKAQQTNRSFVFSQYYVQNIETNLQVDVGASVNAALSLQADGETKQFIIPFIGSGDTGFLKISGTGHLLRQYNATDDRTTYIMNCNVATGNIKLTVSQKVSIINFNVPVDSQYNVFPINSNLSIIVKEGNTFTVDSDIQLLPEATLEIEKNANMVLSAGTECFIFDKADWIAGGYAYGQDLHQLTYVSSKKGAPVARGIDESAKLVIDGTLTIQEGAWMYTTAGYTRKDQAAVEDAKSPDKIVIGSGIIINNYRVPADGDKTGNHLPGKLDAFEFRGSTGFTDVHHIATVPFVGILAGHENNPYTQFSTGTYYGHEDNFWYQYTISLDDASMKYAPYFNVSDDYIGKATGDGNTIAYICAGGTMPFTSDLDVRSTFATVEDKVLTSTGTGNIVLTLTVPFKVQMVLGSSLDMRFAIPASLWSNRYTAKIIKNGASSTAVDWKDATIDGVAYKFFTFYGMTATEMTVILDIAVMDGDTEFAAYQESIQFYAMRMLNDAKYANATEGTTEALARTMLVDMLNYGAAVQTYFAEINNTVPGTLPNSQLTDTQKGWASAADFTDIKSGTSTYTTAALQIAGNIDLLIKFEGEGATNAAYARVEFDSHWDEVVHYLSGQIYSTEIENGVVTVDRLLIADARQPVTVTLYDASGKQIGDPITDSIAAYLKRMHGTAAEGSALKNLCEMTLRFSDSAKAFLHARWNEGPSTGTVTPYEPANS